MQKIISKKINDILDEYDNKKISRQELIIKLGSIYKDILYFYEKEI